MSGMPEVPPQATADRLTVLLRRAGVLGRGEVVDVAVESSRDTLISRISRLRLTYDGDEGPSHVFFKTSAERADATFRELGRKEATFYELVATATPTGLLPARSRTTRAPSSATSPRSRKTWRRSPIVWAIDCPPNAGGSTSGSSMPRRAWPHAIDRTGT
jgi:hypothetical protein